MTLDKKTIQKMADLAKLNLSAKEMADFPGQLSKVIAFVDKINKLNLKNTKLSLSGAGDKDTAWRQDLVKVHQGSILF